MNNLTDEMERVLEYTLVSPSSMMTRIIYCIGFGMYYLETIDRDKGLEQEDFMEAHEVADLTMNDFIKCYDWNNKVGEITQVDFYGKQPEEGPFLDDVQYWRTGIKPDEETEFCIGLDRWGTYLTVDYSQLEWSKSRREEHGANSAHMYWFSSIGIETEPSTDDIYSSLTIDGWDWVQ